MEQNKKKVGNKNDNFKKCKHKQSCTHAALLTEVKFLIYWTCSAFL